MKTKKLREMTIEELLREAKVYTFHTFLILGLGLILTFLEMFRTLGSSSTSVLGVLGFTVSITILMLLRVMMVDFELRLREVMKQ